MSESKQPKLTCPHCSKEIHYVTAAHVPEKQVMSMRLESATGHFSAKTLGATIVEFDKLLKAVARDVGGKVEVFIDSLEKDDKSLTVGFMIATVTGERHKPSAPTK